MSDIEWHGFWGYVECDPVVIRGWRLANVLAVPRTGRRSNGHYYRRPRNIGVKRAVVADDGTLRGAKVPPSSWDDITIEAARSRNWKRHRLTQWHDRYTV
jgi:hypothetical protein